MTYDLAVIGGGPAGYFAAETAAGKGLLTILFEERRLGGTCLNEGCIPTKAMLYSAKLYENAAHSALFGVQTTGASLDHAKVLARKDKVVGKLASGIGYTLKQLGVRVENVRASITEKTEDGFVLEAADARYTARNVLLASGSECVSVPIAGVQEGLKSGYVITSKELLSLSEVPARLTVIGAGVVGLELAAYYAKAGSRVTVIEALKRIGGRLDTDLAQALLASLKKLGIAFYLGAAIHGVGDGAVRFSSDGSGEQTIEADKVLLAAGRRASVHGLGLERLGVELARGAVKTDCFMRTNVPGLYAAGDITGAFMLAHVAYLEAATAVSHLSGDKIPMRYDAVPSVIYTTPEAAWVGESEESAREKGIAYRVASVPMQYSGRYMAETENGNGFCKLVCERESGKIIGVQLLGSYASEIIFSAVMMVEKGMTAREVTQMMIPHPTVCEVLREAALNAVERR